MAGWLNSDLDPAQTSELRTAAPAAVIFLDVTRRFPFGDSSFDYIYSEHVIEHVPYEAGRRMLSECARVLRPGGRIRIATPDLARLVRLYEDRDHLSAEQEAYVRWITSTFLVDPKQTTVPFVLNNAFRAWGHAFLFDEESLRSALVESGFGGIRRHLPRESSDPELKELENHSRVVGNLELYAFETIVLEGECLP